MTEFSVRFTDTAASDLASIVSYLRTHASDKIARRILAELRELADSLKVYPLRGAVPQELAQMGIRMFRQVVRKPYRMVYHVAEQEALILLVADGRRDMNALLQSRLLGS